VREHAIPVNAEYTGSATITGYTTVKVLVGKVVPPVGAWT